MGYNQQKLCLFREVFPEGREKKKWRKGIALLPAAWGWKGASTEIIL